MSFDLKDRKILYFLDENARISFTDLARKVGVSKQVAKYRVEQLEKKNAINTYFAIINVAKLGFTVRKAFVKLQNASVKQEEKLIKYLKAKPDILWVVSCDGQFDLAFGMRSKNIEEYDEKLTKIINEFGKLFLEIQIAPIIKGQYFHRSYLINTPTDSEREFFFGSSPESPKLDEFDWQILVELGKNGRKTATEIAKKVKLSPEAIAKRIKNLERQGVIHNYVLVLNNFAMEQQHFKVLIKLRDINEKKLDAFKEFCKSHPNIFYIVKTFGVWNFEIDLEVKNSEEFREIMRDLKNKFFEIIQDYSYVNIYKIYKYNFCPERPR